jgi:DNA-binding transcriptional MerR regulator
MREASEKFHPTRTLCQRYDVVPRTIDRWIDSGILPPPIWIGGRRYWSSSALEQIERAAIGKRRATAVAVELTGSRDLP